MKLRNIAAAAALLAAPLVSAADYPEVNRYATDLTSDLALIYAGGDQRPKWNVADWTPYVVHTYADGTKDWLFDGFLVLEFSTGSDGICFDNGARGGSASKDDWEALFRRQMKALASLDSTISIYKAELGEPRLRHKVVMGVPSAIKAQNRPFGQIDGRDLDFTKDDDRFAANQWGINRVIDLYNASNFENIDLAGIYWLEEALFTNGAIMPRITDWIYRKGYRSYWIPYYANNEQHKFNWKNYGFDVAYQQPNYFFDREIPMSQLEAACDESKKYGLGMEMEFETQGKSKAQHSDPDSYYDRLVDYLDMYEKKGVFDESAVAWYSGTKGFLDLARSTDPKDHEITDRMARIIAKRQTAKAEELKWPEYDVRDIALIYQGAPGRIDWTKEQITPYVAHTFADGHKDWTFDGYLFLDMPGKIGGSDKQKWEWYLDRLFEKDKSLDALDKSIGDLKEEIGDPGFRHQVYLTVFNPGFNHQNWGELDGRRLDMSVQADREAAAKWFIDQLTSRFKDAGYSNIDLKGLYWFDEDLIHAHDLPKAIEPYISSLGLDFIWIPYFKGRGYERHKEMGFDITYMQPNHFFEGHIPDKRLDETCDIALRNGLAVEFECDTHALSQSTPCYRDRMAKYIDAFEKWGVWDNCPVAYYTGSKALLEMVEQPSPENQEISDRLARIIVERRSKPALNKRNKK